MDFNLDNQQEWYVQVQLLQPASSYSVFLLLEPSLEMKGDYAYILAFGPCCMIQVVMDLWLPVSYHHGVAF